MYGLKIIIAHVILGLLNASVKGRSFSLQNDSPCFPNPCYQGKCRARTQEEGYGYFCQCREGFSGKRCEVRCEDSNLQCPEWAKRGGCTQNSRWMKCNCKLSCKQC